MRAAILAKNGDPRDAAILSVQDGVPMPVPSAGEVLVKVHAAAVNPIDYKLCNAAVPGKKSGRVGFDVAGTVVLLGPGNEGSSLKVGDAVFGDAAKTQGSFAEYMVVQAQVQ